MSCSGRAATSGSSAASGDQRHDGRWWYGTRGSIDFVAQQTCEDSNGEIIHRHIHRRDEIVAGWHRWQADIAAARSRCGLDTADSAYGVAFAAVKDVRLRIVSLVSSDPAVLSLKVRILRDCLAFEDWREALDTLVNAGIRDQNGPWEDAVAFSIVRDLVIAHEQQQAVGGAA